MAGVGRRFRPKEEFLIKVLKWKTKKGDNFDVSLTTAVAGDLTEVCMYGPEKEPWKLFSGALEISELSDTSDVSRKARERYVVAKLNRIGKKNCCRVAGAGYWTDKSTKRPVYVRGEEVGHWKTLNYEYAGGDGAEEGRCYYFMNELHLNQPSDYVVCRVVKNLTKTCQVKFGTKRLRQDALDCAASTKRSRCEEDIPESSSSFRVPQLAVDESIPIYDQIRCEEDIPESSWSFPVPQLELGVDESIPIYDQIDFSDLPGLQEEEEGIPVPQEQAPSLCSNDFAYYVPVMEQNQEPPQMQANDYYVPAQYQEQEVESESWDYPEMQGSCSYSTMPDYSTILGMPNQGCFVDQRNLEALRQFMES